METNHRITPKPQHQTEINCNGCTRCCVKDAVRILPHEDQNKWKTEPHPLFKDTRMLAHKKDRTCYYLTEQGCSIQNDKPQICQEMDCRNIANAISFTQARKAGIALVWKKGKEMAKQQNNAD